MQRLMGTLPWQEKQDWISARTLLPQPSCAPLVHSAACAGHINHLPSFGYPKIHHVPSSHWLLLLLFAQPGILFLSFYPAIPYLTLRSHPTLTSSGKPSSFCLFPTSLSSFVIPSHQTELPFLLILISFWKPTLICRTNVWHPHCITSSIRAETMSFLSLSIVVPELNTGSGT